MEFVNLLGACDRDDGLIYFALSFFKALGITNGEERESDQYADGHYFKGFRDELVFKVASSQEEKNEDLPYWIHITRETIRDESLELTVEHLMKKMVLPKGFRIARIANFGKISERRFDYH